MWAKYMGASSGSLKPIIIFNIEINRTFIFDLRIFTLRTVFMERIAFVNRGMGVLHCIGCSHRDVARRYHMMNRARCGNKW
jgi:hypothetical protein